MSSRVPQPQITESAPARVSATPTTANTSLAKSKSLAAYVLGYNSSIVRLWQFLFWTWKGELDTEGCVPGALREVCEALTELAEEIPENVSSKTRVGCEKLAAITAHGIVAGEGTQAWAYWFKSEAATGYREWRELTALTQDALVADSLSQKWCRLGAAIANYELELFFQEDPSNPRTVPSLQPVLDCAVELSGQSCGRVPEIQRLVRYSLNQPWRPQVVILGGVVETPDCDLSCSLNTFATLQLLARQMTELNCRLQARLRKITLTDTNVVSPEEPPLPPGQQAILDVIRKAGHRLTTFKVVAELEKAQGAASLGTTKVYLADLRRRKLLTNQQDANPKGYGLPEWD